MMDDLPRSVKRTLVTLVKMGEATAEDISKRTGRKRATESYYLNLLARMKIVKKRKIGRKIYYFLNYD
jgi:predicted transcriptional regulator